MKKMTTKLNKSIDKIMRRMKTALMIVWMALLTTRLLQVTPRKLQLAMRLHVIYLWLNRPKMSEQQSNRL